MSLIYFSEFIIQLFIDICCKNIKYCYNEIKELNNLIARGALWLRGQILPNP